MKKERDSKLCGTTTIGERGQVVIPANIRKRMDLKTGDKLLVFCKFDQIIGLIKAKDLNSFLDRMSSHMTEKIRKFKKEIKG
ncbi:MAG: AbrB family transcriptional regulator [Candidatus Kerfeldbacteria bacterium CG_4_10_14_0_8_um_filter_42_10]|uniref:AbrB family transcriptional regulator n=1 Tax=Candidatus Kerfeldbacteria bacterium CG_4_10_14_0_8_um_filter_42_10 TaxID=2014248 RepID=A0A2M7RG83_9BACT|nr:MAG: AbrB family transcriptional regulator [Candidatus Kerfeldbacteria bacterium CG_4_10_14_0_8_um_filter_42_10]